MRRLYRDLNQAGTLSASSALRRLRDAGLLEQKGRGAGTFYLPTAWLLESQEEEPLSSNPTGLSSNPGGLSSNPGGLSSNPGGLSSNPGGLSSNPDWNALPADVQALLKALGKRGQPDKVRKAIIGLCQLRPWQAAELSALLGRSAAYLSTQYLRPLVEAGVLVYLMPDVPNHPHQAYRAADAGTAQPDS